VNLFVSNAMKEDLAKRWGLRGTVFRDHPAEHFVPLSPDARRQVRRLLLERLELAWDPDGFGLVVSPTSWTADEDFDLLLDALDTWEARVAERTRGGETVAPLLVLLTGRGPLREQYERRIADRRPVHAHVRTLWLEAGEYPSVIGAADVGICLHRSASGLDLPMKILDLFGAGVPVFAVDYGPCLAELVREGSNGCLFRTSDDLARLLDGSFAPGPADRGLLDCLRAGVESARAIRWREAWERDAGPVLVPGPPPTR
jgi:beta-1,4-mannosyltransferase